MRPKHLLTSWKISRQSNFRIFCNYFFLIILTGCLLSFRPPGKHSVVNLVVSSPTCFTALDGSINDEDGVANGTLTVSSLTIQSGGSILYNDPGNTCSDAGVPNDSAGPITIVVSGDVDIAGSINTENTIQGGTGGDITLTVGGTFTMESTGLITSSNLTATSGDRSAGDIKIDVTGAISLVPGSEIRANSQNGNGGNIELISYSGNIDIDGHVNSHSISQQSGSGNNQAHGGMIWIQSPLNVLISDEGIVSSAGGDPGADLVHICGCYVTINGLVESTGPGHAIPVNPPNHLHAPFRPDKPSNATGGVEVWACNSLVIDASGTHNGEINANIGSQGGSTGASWIDLFILNGDLTIIGNTSGNFAVHANGTAGTNDSGGVVTLKAVAGNIFLSNLALQASATGSGGSGGIILAEAKQDIVLTSATVQAKGAVTGGAPHGGQISLRSYGTAPSTGSIVADASSTLDVTGDSGDGVVNLTACGSVGFPPGIVTPVTPTITHACDGAPDISTTQPYVEFCCCCSGEITITKILFGTAPSSDWHYTSNIPGHTSFTLPAAGGTVTFHNVPNGQYTVTETNQESPDCPDQHLPYRVSNTCQATENDTLTATINIVSCQPAACTFTNRAPNCTVCTTTALAGPDQELCNVTSVTLAGNNPSSGTGTWTKVSGTGGTITSPNQYNTTVTGLTPGVYVFKWKIVDGPCKDSDNVQITIDAKITALAGPDQALCDVTSVTLAGNDPSPGTGVWSQVSGASATITTPTQFNTTVTGLTTGVYVFKWKISNGLCSDSDNVQITISTKITADAGPDQALCNVTSATLAGNDPSPGTGTWSKVSGPSATITSIHQFNTTVTGLTPGVYIFKWKIVNGACKDSDNVQITIYAKITANAGPDQDLCNVTSATLAGNNPSPGTGTWTQISGGAATITSIHLRNTTVTGLTLGTYVFQWTIVNGECIDSDRVQIKIENCVCLGGGGGLTPGFWSNKNGQALETAADFCFLNTLCLVNGTGTDFNPGTYCPTATNNQLKAEKTAFATWLLNGNAVSMAYMLSVQFSAMTLNVAHGFVNGGALVYAPGAGNTGAGNNYITINDLLAEANTALCADGYTPSGDPNRAFQEAIKNALDNANNNKNFVQSTCSGAVNSFTIITFARMSTELSDGDLSLKAAPNPTSSQFTLKIQSDNRKDAISIRIFDMYGRVVETFTKLSVGQTLRLGSKYISGIYIAELIQGKNHQQIKLIKQ